MSKNRLKIVIFEISNGRISDADDPKNLKIGETNFFGTYFHWLKLESDLRTSCARFCRKLFIYSYVYIRHVLSKFFVEFSLPYPLNRFFNSKKVDASVTFFFRFSDLSKPFFDRISPENDRKLKKFIKTCLVS